MRSRLYAMKREGAAMGVAVKREWIEAAQRERRENRRAKAVDQWDNEGGASVSGDVSTRTHSRRDLNLSRASIYVPAN